MDPAVWGKNFPIQYDGYQRTVDMERTQYGGSEALPHTATQADPRGVVARSKLEADPRLAAMWAGYAFATDFREAAAMPTCWRTSATPDASPNSNSPAPASTATRPCMSLMKKLGERRPVRGLREAQPYDLPGGHQTRPASGSLHRLPRSEDDAAADHAPAFMTASHTRRQGAPTTMSTAMPRRRRCAATSAASATWSITSRVPKSA